MRYYCTEERHSISGNGVFYLGRCEELAEELIDKYAGKIQLVYLDPPFCTGNSFSFKVGKGKNAVTVPAYSDERSIGDFIEWMRKVLVCCHKLLCESGSVYLHIDYRTTAQMRLLMDEVFGEKNFLNEIIWPYKTGGRSTRYFPRKHDTILLYRKGPKHYFNISAVGVPRGAERRNHMKRFISEDGRVAYSIRSGGKLYTYYEDTLVYPSDVWADIIHLQQKDKERTGYATQKPEALLDRIILSSSKPGDIVADLFSGSGTTAMSACKNGRSFVVADESPLSAYVIRKRFMGMTGINSLLNENNNCLRLKYPIDKSECKVDYAIVKRRGVRYVELRSAVFEDPTDTPLYIACGCVQGETFISASINQTPRLPAKLMLADESINALHIVSAKGKQVFVGLEA